MNYKEQLEATRKKKEKEMEEIADRFAAALAIGLSSWINIGKLTQDDAKNIIIDSWRAFTHG